MTLGRATHGFLASPAKLDTAEFFGVAFLIVAMSLYWAHHIDKM